MQYNWYKNMGIATFGKGSSSQLIFATKKRVAAKAITSLWAGNCSINKIKTSSSKRLVDLPGLRFLKL